MGVAAMLFIGKINYQRFRALAKPLLYVSIVLLVLVVIPGPNQHGKLLGQRANNAVRWLGIPGTSFQFQPSEIAKMAVVLYFADSISKKKDKMRTFRYGIAPYALVLIVLAALVGIGAPPVRRHPDLGRRRRDDAGGRHPVEMGGRRPGRRRGHAVSGAVRHRLQHHPHHLLAGPLGGPAGAPATSCPRA